MTGILRSLRKRLSGRRKARFLAAAESLLGGQKPHLVDVGAAGALPPAWEDWRKQIAVTAFEPDAAAAKRLKQRYPEKDFQVIAQALSQTGGNVALHILNTPTGSSLKKLKNPLPAYVDESYCYPCREISIETIPLEEGLRRSGRETFAGIKLDTQGSELEILQSLPTRTLQEAVFIETEIGMPGAYAEAPRLTDWLAFLEPLGFQLYDLHPLRTPLVKFRKQNQDLWKQLSVPPGDPSVSQRLWEADALFFNCSKLQRAAGNLKDLQISVACLCLYRFFLEALDLVAQAQEQGGVDVVEGRTLRESILKIHRNISRDALEVGFFSPLLTLGEVFRSRRHARWCQYRFYDAPQG